MIIVSFVLICALAIYGWICAVRKLHLWAVRKLDERLQCKLDEIRGRNA